MRVALSECKQEVPLFSRKGCMVLQLKNNPKNHGSLTAKGGGVDMRGRGEGRTSRPRHSQTDREEMRCWDLRKGGDFLGRAVRKCR